MVSNFVPWLPRGWEQLSIPPPGWRRTCVSLRTSSVMACLYCSGCSSPDRTSAQATCSKQHRCLWSDAMTTHALCSPPPLRSLRHPRHTCKPSLVVRAAQPSARAGDIAWPVESCPDHLDAVQLITDASGGDSQGHRHRRDVLRGAAAVAASTGLTVTLPPPAAALKSVVLKDGSEVQVYEHGMSLSIVALRGTVPSQWVVDFRQCLGRYAGFSLGQRTQLEELYAELSDREGAKSAGSADVITLGDAWLASAIRNGLIQPLAAAETYRWWRGLPPHWQALMQRDPVTGAPSSSGPVWGCPYRWAANLVLYKHDKLTNKGHAILDWPDLLQPALKRAIAFPTSTREFVGCALKTLGVPGIGFNSTAADLAAAGISREAARDAVRKLRGQALLFSDRDHVRALQAGDALAVVGNSTDLLPLAERSYTMDLLVPASGTLLWADCWVVPAGAKGGHLQAGPSPILPSWLEFCTQGARAATLNGFRSGITPALLPPPLRPPPSSKSSRSSSSSPSSSSSSSKSGRRSWWRWWGKVPAAAPAGAPQSQAAAAEEEGSAAAQGGWRPLPAPPALTREQLRLTNENSFMPQREVLSRSEFLLPLDAGTVEFYRWLMQ